MKVTKPQPQSLTRKFINNLLGQPQKVMKGKMTVEVVPPSRTAKDMHNYITAIRAAESPIWSRRKELYEIYTESIDYDSHLRAVWAKRVGAVLAKDFTYLDGAGNPVEMLDNFMDTPRFRNFVRDLVETRFWGHSLFEFNPTDGDFAYTLVPRPNVDPVRGMVLKLPYMRDGIEYRTPEWAPWIMEVGEKYDLGILKTAARYAIYKRNMLSDWANYSELAGNNFEKFVYEGEDEAVKQQIKTVMEQAGSGSRLGLPRGVDFDVRSTSNSATNQLFEGFNQAMNDELSKLFLGQTMTTEDGSSRSQAQIHLGEQEMLYSDDVIYISYILNHQFRPYLQIWNMPTDGVFVARENSSIQELRELERLEKVAKLRGAYSDQYLITKFDLPNDAFQTAQTPATE